MTKFPARAILLLALSAIFYPALAQEATRIQGDPSRISGTVVSAASGSPLAGARVSITDVKDRKNQRTLLTGDDGHFSLCPSGQILAGGCATRIPYRGLRSA